MKWLWLILFITSAALVGLFVIGQDDQPLTPERLGSQIEIMGENHIETGAPHEAYNSNPPTSGPHYASTADWGVSTETLSDELVLHNLEHGGIVISYRPDLPTDQIEELKNLYDNLKPSPTFKSRKAIIMPRAANERAISLTAWGYVLHLDNLDKNQVYAFYESHLDNGPEDAP